MREKITSQQNEQQRDVILKCICIYKLPLKRNILIWLILSLLQLIQNNDIQKSMIYQWLMNMIYQYLIRSCLNSSNM